MRPCIVLALVVVLATSASALEKKAYQMREDFGTESLQPLSLQYYYDIPCPTLSYYWAVSGWSAGDIIGHCFNIGDRGTHNYLPLDPTMAQTLWRIYVLDFAGYGTNYPGLFTVEFDVYCAPEGCCGSTAPTVHIWNSGPVETGFAWNSVYVDPPVSLCPCWGGTADPYTIVVTATHTGWDGSYPAWGMDNISSPVEMGCEMHDFGCLPAVYPRGPCGAGGAPMVHSGYIGTFPFQYWPPIGVRDGKDTTPDCTQFGFIELVWRIDLINSGPTTTEPTAWGSIKSMYK